MFMQEKRSYEYTLGETRTHEIDISRRADHLPSHRGRRLWFLYLGSEWYDTKTYIQQSYTIRGRLGAPMPHFCFCVCAGTRAGRVYLLYGVVGSLTMRPMYAGLPAYFAAIVTAFTMDGCTIGNCAYSNHAYSQNVVCRCYPCARPHTE